MMRFRCPVILGVLLLLVAPAASAATPSTMNFQGRLTDNSPSQTPIDITLPMEFRIYDALTGGALLWSESWPAVTVTGGLFSVILGSNGTPLTEAVFAAPDRYVEIVVNGEILAPRQTISAVGFAQQANNSDALDGSPASSWQMRITGGCPTGQHMRIINQDGTVICEADASNIGDITDVFAGVGLTGGGPIGAVGLSADFAGDGNADTVARSDHAHGGGPLPPGSAQRATLSGSTIGIVFGWLSGEEPLSRQVVDLPLVPTGESGVFEVPVPDAISIPVPDGITFSTYLGTGMPLLRWFDESFTHPPADPLLDEVSLVLENEQGNQVRRIDLVDAWPAEWSLAYLPSGEVIVNVQILHGSVLGID